MAYELGEATGAADALRDLADIESVAPDAYLARRGLAPVPLEPRPAAANPSIGGRGALARSGSRTEVRIGPINVNSNASDPRQVAMEVADEIERRQRDERLRLESAVFADDTTEAEF